MRPIILFIFVIFFSTIVRSQIVNVDSLCNSLYWTNTVTNKIYKNYPSQINLSFKSDTTKSLNKRYFRYKSRSEISNLDNVSSLTGWFTFTLNNAWSSVISPIIVGIYTEDTPSTTRVFHNFVYSYIRVDGCFNDGEPCCTWEYTIENLKTKKFTIYKTVNFKDGLLDGEYKIYQGYSNVIYKTSFENGTGYYKEYMHDPYSSNEDLIVILEGALINGLRHGEWKYYIYNDYSKSKFIEIVTETFDMGNHVTTSSTKKKK